MDKYNLYEKDVLNLHLTRITALINKDNSSLLNVLSPNLRFVHATGRIDNFESYFNFLPTVQYIDIDVFEREIEIIGDIAVITGRMNMTIKKEGVENVLHPKSLIMEVWLKDENDVWKMKFFQSTPAPIDE